MGLKSYHKKTPFPGQGPYNPPPPHEWIAVKISQLTIKTKKIKHSLKKY
jgi:hypothetical protein